MKGIILTYHRLGKAKYKPWKACMLLFLSLPFCAMAQSDLLLYNYTSIPQSIHTNPGIIPRNTWVIGLPVVSSFQNKLYNGSFTINQLLRERAQDDSLMLDIPGIITGLKKNNRFSEHSSIDLLFVGIKVKNSYLSFGVKSDAFFNLNYPKDLVDFIWYGNAKYINRELDISDMKVNFHHYLSYYFGFAIRASDRFSLGFRIKSLHGLSNIKFEKMDVKLRTLYDQQNLFTFYADNDILINTSGIEDLEMGANSGFDVMEYLNAKKNSGFGIDFGFNWRMTRNFNLSVSVLDIGYLYWVTKNKNYVTTLNRIEFGDVHVNLTDNINALNVYIDSLNNLFSLKELHRQYNTTLPARLHVAGFLKIHGKNRLGFLMAHRFIDGFIESDYCLSYDRIVGKGFSFKAAWSVVDGTYYNLGIGAEANFGPFQVYFLTENIFGLIDPWSVNNHAFRFGFSIAILKKDHLKEYDIIETQYDGFKSKKHQSRPDGTLDIESQRKKYWNRKLGIEDGG